MTALLVFVLMLASSQARPLLDVPFVSQTPALCGGAAVSMVMRYWGQREIFPEDFAPLVSDSDGGIFTSVLAKSVSDRGWIALVEPASADTSRARVRAEIDRGRPVIALIEVAPRTYHYIVIVAATDAEVVFHDPARGPFRVMDWSRFTASWSAARFWMMVALPPAGFSPRAAAEPSASAPVATATPATPCSGLVAHAVQAALAGDTAAAEQELTAAMRLCPTDLAPLWEMAGLRFSQKRWSDADRLATLATQIAPQDAYAWELAATSRYLDGNSAGALLAWNRIGEPKIDVVKVIGAERTHLPVVERAAGLKPRSLLTPERFARAERRLNDLPAVSSARMKFEPAARGLANVDVVIVEKSGWPQGAAGWLMLAARSAAQRELRVEASGLSGAGESAYAAWRFRENRPRVTVGLSFPSPPWLPGVATFSGMWEQQNYAITGDPIRQSRRRASLQLSDWASGWLKWEAGIATDSFDGAGHLAADASLVVMPRGDRAAAAVTAGAWAPFSGGREFSSFGTSLSLRSTADPARAAISSVVEWQRTSGSAPLALWPGAGKGGGRRGLLRAHRLIDEGVVTGDVFGRELLNSTVEYGQPVADIRSVTVAIAGFVDAARASRRVAGLHQTPVYIDAGIGLRMRLPGSSGVLRLDAAYPLRGRGEATFSAGWIAGWPR